jgi:hypothetical protein
MYLILLKLAASFFILLIDAVNSWSSGVQAELSTSQQQFQRKFGSFIKLFRNKVVICICSHAMQQFFHLLLAVLNIILPHTEPITVDSC